MEKKKIGVTLPASLHNSIKMLAVELGLNTEEAYQEALTHYIGEMRGSTITSHSVPALRLARAYDVAVSIPNPSIRRIVESLAGTVEEIAGETIALQAPAPKAKVTPIKKPRTPK